MFGLQMRQFQSRQLSAKTKMLLSKGMQDLSKKRTQTAYVFREEKQKFFFLMGQTILEEG